MLSLIIRSLLVICDTMTSFAGCRQAGCRARIAGLIVVYKIPCRRARAWPSASREQRYLAYKADYCARLARCLARVARLGFVSALLGRMSRTLPVWVPEFCVRVARLTIYLRRSMLLATKLVNETFGFRKRTQCSI